MRPEGHYGFAHDQDSKQRTDEVVRHGVYDDSYHATGAHLIDDGDGLLYKGTIQEFHVDFHQFIMLCEILRRFLSDTQQDYDCVDPASDADGDEPPTPSSNSRSTSDQVSRASPDSPPSDNDDDSPRGSTSPPVGFEETDQPNVYAGRKNKKQVYIYTRKVTQEESKNSGPVVQADGEAYLQDLFNQAKSKGDTIDLSNNRDTNTIRTVRMVTNVSQPPRVASPAPIASQDQGEEEKQAG